MLDAVGVTRTQKTQPPASRQFHDSLWMNKSHMNKVAESRGTVGTSIAERPACPCRACGLQRRGEEERGLEVAWERGVWQEGRPADPPGS